MKLEIIEKFLSEDKDLAELSAILEKKYSDAGDLQEIDDDQFIDTGIKYLQMIIKGDTDDFSSNDIEVAMKTWSFLRNLLLNSVKPLKKELDITNIGKKHQKQPELDYPSA